MLFDELPVVLGEGGVLVYDTLSVDVFIVVAVNVLFDLFETLNDELKGFAERYRHIAPF